MDGIGWYGLSISPPIFHPTTKFAPKLFIHVYICCCSYVNTLNCSCTFVHITTGVWVTHSYFSLIKVHTIMQKKTGTILYQATSCEYNMYSTISWQSCMRSAHSVYQCGICLACSILSVHVHKESLNQPILFLPSENQVPWKPIPNSSSRKSVVTKVWEY